MGTEKSLGFREDIQGLRAVAVLLVIAYHAGAPITGGYLGVDVFFVVSGFLITGLLVEELTRTGRIRLASFFARRVRRLLPALAVMTTVTVLVSHFVVELGRPLRSVAQTGLAASLFSANFQLYRAADYFSPSAERNPLLHTWSLSVEEQFYLVLPFVLLAALRLGTAALWPRRVTGVVVIGLTSSLALAVLLVDLGWGPAPLGDGARFAFYAPISRAWEFLAGALLALAHHGRSRAVSEAFARATAVVGFVLVATSSALLTGSSAVPGLVTIPVVVGTLMLVWSGTHSTGGQVQRILRTRIMNWIGDRSYGLYLWHWPALVFAEALWPAGAAAKVSALGLSVLLADASFRFVETPLRGRVTAAGGRTTIAIAVAAVTVPAVISLGVLLLSDPYGTTEASEEVRNCQPVSGWPEGCLVNRFGSAAPVFLLAGDSHCEALIDGAVEAAARLEANIAFQCQSATPLVAASADTTAGAAFVALQEGLRVLSPDAVIVANRSSRNLEPDAWRRWANGSFTDRAEAAAAWSTVVSYTARSILTETEKLIWVGQVAEFPDAVIFGPSRLRSVVPARISLPELELQRGDVQQAERSALSGLSGVWRVDPGSVFCTETCVSGEGQVSYYRDDNHLNMAGSLQMSDALAQAMRDALGLVG